VVQSQRVGSLNGLTSQFFDFATLESILARAVSSRGGTSLARYGMSWETWALFTITEKGFTVQANGGGTKYFKDAELN